MSLAGRVHAQAVPRADLPGPRSVRLSFDTRLDWWNAEYVDGTLTPLGAPMTGDPLSASPALPGLAQLQADLATAGNVAPSVLVFGRARLSALAQRRTTPIAVEFGVTSRLAVGILVPLVRTMVRTSLILDTTGANLALNPLLTDPVAVALYTGFFNAFDASLGRLQADIAGGSYGCPSSPQCVQAQAFLAEAQGVRDALYRSTYGPGAGGGAGFLPRAGSTMATAVDSNLIRLQNELRASYGDSTFGSLFPFPADSAALTAAGVNQALGNGTWGYGLHPFGDTPRRERFWLGDVELQARYQLIRGPVWTATAGLLWRMGTGHQESPNDALDLSAGDGQSDIEAQLVQEVNWHRAWLNLSLRGGVQRPGTRARRVGPAGAFLLVPQAQALLDWDPGDYVGVDFAPLYRFHPQFAAGFTLGWFHKGEDRYRFASAQDSVDLATRFGAPLAANTLDAGSAQRRARLGVALSYVGPAIETGVTAERTLSGGAGRVPAGWSIRLVARVAYRPF